MKYAEEFLKGTMSPASHRARLKKACAKCKHYKVCHPTYDKMTDSQKLLYEGIIGAMLHEGD